MHTRRLVIRGWMESGPKTQLYKIPINYYLSTLIPLWQNTKHLQRNPIILRRPPHILRPSHRLYPKRPYPPAQLTTWAA